MHLTLPEPLEQALAPLFDHLPLKRAMSRLVVAGDGADPQAVQLVEQLLDEPTLAGRDALAAGLWLYVDELDRSHRLSQQIDTPTGAFWHAIMHRREGDFSNSKYWYRRAGAHPALGGLDVSGGSAGAGTTVGLFQADTFVDRVQRAYEAGEEPAELVALQRREWVALFEWVAEH